MGSSYKNLWKLLEFGQAVPADGDRSHVAENTEKGCVNSINGQIVREPVDGSKLECTYGFSDRWYAPAQSLPNVDISSFNGIWSEVCATADPKRLINPGVDNYVVIKDGAFERFSLEGELLQKQTLMFEGDEIVAVDGQNNKNRYHAELAEYSGGYRLECVGGPNAGHIISLRPWLDHMFTVKGSFSDGSEFGTFFVGILNGTATWRTEDEVYGAVSACCFSGDELSFTFDRDGSEGPKGRFCISGKVTKLSDGIIWKADGVVLRFVRNFDGIWRCPGFNTFCLSSMGNVKTFQNYEKKYRTPVIFICDYERSLIIERYLDRRRLTYRASFYQTSQIMDGLDGIDLGRRFENLYYLDGVWEFEEDAKRCELLIYGKECNLNKADCRIQGRIEYYEGLLTIRFGSEKLNFIVDINGLNSFSLLPVLAPEKSIRLNRSVPF
jgi:hypothetical protein